MKVVVLTPHGFCGGVAGALGKAHSLLATRKSGEVIYCLHELVHNELVVADLRSRGLVFVESVEEIPCGATVLFSAHGVSPSVRAAAQARSLQVVDATCPFVERVHRAARAFSRRALPVIVIGKPHHAEVRGIAGEVDGEIFFVRSAQAAQIVAPTLAEGTAVGVVSQTTMNADEVAAIVAILARRFRVETTAKVCQATKMRQDAVRQFTGEALLVLGSASSSNTQRLCEVASCRVFRAGTMAEVAALDLTGIEVLGVTSGASTPESFFQAAVKFLSGGF